MNNTKGAIHFEISASNEELKRKLAESRQALLDSGRTAEAEGSKIEGMFKRAALAAGGFFTAQQALSFGQSVIRVRGEMQMMEKSFEVLLQSKSKAMQMIAEIKQLAIDSPLEMPQVSGAVQTLLGFGVSAEKVMGIVGQLSDVSMGNADQFRSLALVYAQTQSAGKLMGQDLLQMINAGFNPLQVISEQTGKSIAQLKDEMSKGAISAEMVANAFAAVTSEGGKFYQMTQKQAEGIVGLQATFEDAITNQMNRFGEKNEELIADGFRFATSVVENADTIGKTLATLVAAYGSYKAAIIATNAVQSVITNVQYSTEIAELTKLLPLKQAAADADLKEAVASGRLTQAKAEQLISIRAEINAQMEKLRQTVLASNAEYEAAKKNLENAKVAKIAAEDAKVVQQQALQSVIATAQIEKAASLDKLIAIESEKQSVAGLLLLKLKSQKESAITAMQELLLQKSLGEAAGKDITSINAKIVAKQNEINTVSAKIKISKSEEIQCWRNVISLSNEKKAIDDNITSKDIEEAKTAINVAGKNAETAAINVQNASRDMLSKKAAVQVAVSKMERFETNANAAASLAAAKAKNIFTAATMRLSAAMKSLKAAFLSNPLGVVITLLTTAASAAYMFGKKTEDAADHTDMLNKSITDLGIETAKEAQEIDNAFAKLLKAKKGTQEYGAAKDAIISKYGSYLSGLSAEISTLADVEGAYNAVRNAAESSANARFKTSFIDDATKAAAERMGGAIDNIMKNVRRGFSEEAIDMLPLQISSMTAEITAALTSSERTLKEKKLDVGAILENYGLTTRDAMKVMKSMDFFDWGNREDYVSTFEEAFQTVLNIKTTAEEAFGALSGDQTDKGKELETVLQRRIRLTRELTEAEKLLSNMKQNSSTSTDVEITAQQKRVDDLKAALNIKKKSSAPKDYTEELKKNDSDRIRQAKDLEFACTQAIIDAKEDGIKKTLAQNKLNYDKEIEQLRRQKEDRLLQLQEWERTAWEAKNPNWKKDGKKFTPQTTELPKQEADAFDAMKVGVTAKFTSSNKDAYNNELNEYAQFAQAYIDKANEFKESLKNVEDTIRSDRAELVSKGASKEELGAFDAQANATIEGVKGVQQTMLTGMDEQMEMKNQTFVGFIESMVDMGIDQLIDALNTAKTLLSVFSALGNTGAAEQQQAQIKALENQITALSKNKKETKGTKEVTGDPTKKWQNTLSIMNDVKGITNDIIGSFDGMDDTTKVVLDAAMNISTGVINMIMGITMLTTGSIVATTIVSETSTEAIKKVERASVILAIIGAAIQVVMAIVNVVMSLVSNNKKVEKSIKDAQVKVDELSKSYEKLQKEIDKAYSTDASEMIAQGDEMLRQQNELIKNQITLEESNKNPDEEALKKHNEDLDKNNELLEENKEKAIDVIFGSDLQSAVDDFANAYADAFASGESTAKAQKDVVKDMINNIVREMIKSDIADKVKIMREKIASMIDPAKGGDNDLSEAELAEIDRLGDSVTAELEHRKAMYDKLLKDDSLSMENSLTGAIRGTVATEESVAVLGGIFRGQYDTLKRIEAVNTKQFDFITSGWSTIADISRSNLEIAANTLRSANNTDGLKESIQGLKVELVEITRNTKKDNGKYN